MEPEAPTGLTAEGQSVNIWFEFFAASSQIKRKNTPIFLTNKLSILILFRIIATIFTNYIVKLLLLRYPIYYRKLISHIHSP